MADQWYYSQLGKHFGPLTSAQLQQLAAAGQLLPTDPVIKQGMSSWVTARQIQGLYRDTPATPTPPVPPPPNPLPQEDAQAVPPASSRKSFADWAKASAVSVAASAKAAAQLAAKQAERVKITQVSLPNAYLALGKEIHGAGRFRNVLDDLFTELDTILAKLQALKQTPPPPSGQAQSLTDKAKAAAGHAKDLAKGKALEMEANSVLRQLGETVYQKYGEQSGKAQLTQPIVQCHARIQALDLEIGQISASHSHGFVTPRRLLVGGVVVIAIPLFIVGRLFQTESEPNAPGQTVAGGQNNKSPTWVKINRRANTREEFFQRLNNAPDLDGRPLAPALRERASSLRNYVLYPNDDGSKSNAYYRTFPLDKWIAFIGEPDASFKMPFKNDTLRWTYRCKDGTLSFNVNRAELQNTLFTLQIIVP